MLNQASGDRRILAKQLNISPHQLSYVTNSGAGEGLIFTEIRLFRFKDRFDNSLMLCALMSSKPEDVEKREKLGIKGRDDVLKRRQDKMRKWLAGLLFIVSVVLLTISIYFLMGMFCRRDRIISYSINCREVLQEKSDETGEDSSGDSLTQIDTGILALHEENPDCIGWITIEGTRIDYPVMHRPGDKDYYLHRDFNGEYSANGCLYLAGRMCAGRFRQSDYLWSSI